MKIITSKGNQLYKNALKLKRKKYRDETGMYLLEGIKPLEDALRLGISIETIFVREGDGHERLFDGLPVVITAGELFDALSDTEHSQGVVAVAEKTIYSAEGFRSAAGNGNVLIMDRLQDPGNIGTMIRTAEAAGYGGIVMIAGSSDVYSPKVVRAAAGSLFRVPVIGLGSAVEAIELMRDMGRRIVVTSLDAPCDCFESDMTGSLALVIGNEGSGVSRAFTEAADMKIRIPMEGSIESLNAAVAAGILMYQSRKNINVNER